MKRLCEMCGKMYEPESDLAFALRDFFCSDECCERHVLEKEEIEKKRVKGTRKKKGE